MSSHHVLRHVLPRRLAALTGVAALFAAGLVLSSEPASGGPRNPLDEGLRSAPRPLTTPFEDSNGANWTTEPQAEQFLADLDAASPRVKVNQVGTTIQGRPLQLVQIGDPAPKSAAQAAGGSVLMYVCSVHGDEPSGREACMQLERDMAFSKHPAVKRLIRETTVLFINANPDGWVADTRGNANGVDINRDYMEAATPEGRAVLAVMRDWKPDVLGDLHEYGPNQYYKTDLLQLWPRNRQADKTIYALSKEMTNDYAGPAVTDHGYSTGVYGEWVKDGESFLQVAGDGQARILRNYAGLEHVVGMLSETATDPLNDAEAADESLLNRRRVDSNYSSAIGVATMIDENRGEIAKETAAAAKRATAKGAAQSGVVYFAGQDNMLPTSNDQVDPTPMCGYQLSAAQLADLRPTLELHGITWQNNAAGAYVTMAQPDQPLIPLLFDARSEFRLTEATPLDAC